MKVGISTSSFGQADDAPLKRLTAAGAEVVANPYGRRLTRDEAVRFVSNLDGLIAGLEPLDEGVLRSAARLKAIARVGIGMENVDQGAAADLGILVSNTPDPPTFAVAELTMTAMLSLLRGFPSSVQSFRGGEWNKTIGRSLAGAAVLVVGFGRIGTRVAELVTSFGASVQGVDPAIEPERVPSHVEMVKLEVGLRTADVVTLHASGADTILGASELSLLKRGAVLLNASRGSLVEEEALADALESGRVGSAWFDAFWEEPYEGTLRQHPNFFGTPHTATYTAHCRRAMEMEAVENLLAHLRGAH